VNVHQIAMPREAALEQVRIYREYIRRHKPDEELLGVLAGYEALAKGNAIVNLPQAIGNAGWKEDGWPVLAVARADASTANCRVGSDAVRFFIGSHWRSPDYRKKKATKFEISRSRFPARPQSHDPWATVETIVPVVPPMQRRKAVGGLSGYVILWEVDEWKMTPSTDPLLLKQLAGDLYAVIAAWDLTEVEKAVIAGTRAH